MQTIMGQAAFVDWVRRLSKMVRYASITLIVLAGVWRVGVAQAATMNCTITPAPNLNIGSVNVLQDTPATVSSTFNYTCTGNKLSNKSYFMLCFSIDSGSGGASYNPRLLQLKSDTTKTLQFGIYRDPQKTIWGPKNNPVGGNPVALGPFYASNQTSNVYTGALTLYSTVLPGQNMALKGDYSSDFTAGHTTITWDDAISATPNPVTPSMCSGTRVTNGDSTFGFTVIATVANQCYATTSDLNFGSVSSVAAGPITGTSTINVQCTNGTPYQVGLDNGSNSTGGTNRSMKDPATARLVRYDLYQDAGRTARWGNNNLAGGDTLNNQTGSGIYKPITVYGQAYPDSLVTVGNYADTVSVVLYF